MCPHGYDVPVFFSYALFDGTFDGYHNFLNPKAPH